MSAPGAPGTAGGAAGPSTACGDSPLGPEELASLFSDPFSLLSEDQAEALLGKLVGEDDPRVAGAKRLLQDEEACGNTLKALQALSLVPSDRWGEAVAVREGQSFIPPHLTRTHLSHLTSHTLTHTHTVSHSVYPASYLPR